MEEFRSTMVETCGQEDSLILEMFEALDSNHDGQITYSDFLAAMIAVNIELTDNLLQTAFRKFDTRNDDHLTGESFRDILGDEYEGENVASIMSTSADGKICYTEFA